MFRWIYALPLKGILFLMGMIMILWGYLSEKLTERHWKTVNISLFAVSLMGILFVTLHRTSGTRVFELRPFAALAAAKRRPELYRQILMNVFLFFPLGLSLSNILPRKRKQWRRILFTTVLSCLLSAGIEYLQYRYLLGFAETDDVICNTLGAFLGACSLLIAHAIQTLQGKQ